MPEDTTLSIRQHPPVDGKCLIRLTLKRPGEPDLEAEATIEFALTPQQQEDLRWYLEDYLQRAESVEEVQIKQIEGFMKERGEELYTKVLTANQNTQAIWFAVRERLADLRVEIRTEVAEAASIPWELMRDPQSDSAVALRVKCFVRVQSNPNIGFIKVPKAHQGRIRLLYVVCRPSGRSDVELRAVANRLVQDLGEDRARFEIKALRPPTFEALQKELDDAKQNGRPYHIVHFDGHGVYAELKQSVLKDWLAALSHLTLGGKPTGKHGFLLFESPQSEHKMRPVDGQTLGQLLHDNGVPILVLNACQSAMHEAGAAAADAQTVHDEVRAIGSLAQTVVDQGIPAVLGMRYSVFVVTAAQYIGELYRALAKGNGFGEAASQGRKHLSLNPERWIGLQPRPLQDWFVPVVYEAAPMKLVPAGKPLKPAQRPELDPVQLNPALLRYVPDHGFVGRDETLLMLDRAFDVHPVVLLHAYAGQGKTTTAVEFARWYAQTGGLGAEPMVVFTSFEHPVTLDRALDGLIGAKSKHRQPLLSLLASQGKEWLTMNEPAKKRSEAIKLLRQVPILWIWDNVEPVTGFPEGTESAWTVEEQAELADFLKQIKLDNATKAKILLTSRRDEQKWLGGIPHRVEMPRMRVQDGAALALKLGEEKGLTRGEIANWQPLLDYCAGNPLTLRVIVGQAVHMGLRGKEQIAHFVEAVCEGEQRIEDADADQGRDKSLGASLEYGFRNAFQEDELPIIALLHLFQGMVSVQVLRVMGDQGEYSLPEMRGKRDEDLKTLLERARDTGLLTQIRPLWFAIHPALPWFLGELFSSYYDSQDGRSRAGAALRAWVEAVGNLGQYCLRQFCAGNRDVIQLLALEEANLLQARRLARRHGWWARLISAMQGLRCLYHYQGRGTEWARLVGETVPDYCTEDDEPVPGREAEYPFVMDYCVQLAVNQHRDFARAAALQKKALAWARRRGAAVLALPDDVLLDDKQSNRLRTLATAVVALGQVLHQQGSRDCVEHYKEGIRYAQRIKDAAGEAIVYSNLGQAYMDLPDIRDLDAAEAACQRSLELHDPNDALGRSQCIKRIGAVHYQRFWEALHQGAPPETLLRHAQAAAKHYQQALDLCPASALADRGSLHNAVGALSDTLLWTAEASEHYEKAAHYAEQSGNRHGAGTTRGNIALMYVRVAEREGTQGRQRDFLLRAQAYAQAALRDFQHFEGRADAEEARVQRLLDDIRQQLAQLPQ